MVLPLPDLLTLAAICRSLRPQRVFEIGTFTGSTTLVMAMNTADDSEILTLDLDPHAMGPQPIDPSCLGYDPGCVFRGTKFAEKIRQLYGRSELFDFSPYSSSVDLVYIDADHSYEAVKIDTARALQLVRPGGVIIWDDYLWQPYHASCAGVTQWLNEFARSRPCYQISGTRLAAYVNCNFPQSAKGTN